MENPYWQFFTGETYLQTEAPVDPSSLTRWRKRIGEEGVETLLALAIEAARKAGMISKASQEKANELTQQLHKVNLPVLERDVERLERSAKQAEAAHSQRANEITRLEVELETNGALGQEETAAEKQREFEHMERRCAELDHRAKALDHLLKLLCEKRSALARRLSAPLQKHLVFRPTSWTACRLPAHYFGSSQWKRFETIVRPLIMH